MNLGQRIKNLRGLPNLYISVIVPAKNEENRIKPMLEALYSAIRNRNIEVIIIDDGSIDNTVSIVKSYGARIIEGPAVGDIGATRNMGIKAAKGNIIASLDADSIVPDDYIDRIIEEFSDNQIEKICFPIKPYSNRHNIQISISRAFLKLGHFCNEGAIAFKKEVVKFCEIGGFEGYCVKDFKYLNGKPILVDASTMFRNRMQEIFIGHR